MFRRRTRTLTDLLAHALTRPADAPAAAVLVPRWQPEGRYHTGHTDGFRPLRLPAPNPN